MRIRTLANVVIMAVLAFGASGANAQDEIQELADKWVEAYNKHDKNKLGALYSENAALMMHGGATIRGRRAIVDFWETDFEVGSPLTLLHVTHSVTGVDMMLVHGNYQVIDRDDGAKLGSGRFAHIWTLGMDDQWYLDRDLWNDPFDPYE